MLKYVVWSEDEIFVTTVLARPPRPQLPGTSLGGARIIYVYVVIAARVFLIRCYAKNVKTITRQAYGFRNFENYRQRVQVLCG